MLFGNGFFDPVISLHLLDYGFSQEDASFIYIGGCVAYALFSYLSGTVIKYFDGRFMIFVGLLSFGIGFAFIGPMQPIPDNVEVVLTGVMLEGIGSAISLGKLQAVAVMPHLMAYSSEVMNLAYDDKLSDAYSSTC